MLSLLFKKAYGAGFRAGIIYAQGDKLLPPSNPYVIKRVFSFLSWQSGYVEGYYSQILIKKG